MNTHRIIIAAALALAIMLPSAASAQGATQRDNLGELFAEYFDGAESHRVRDQTARWSRCNLVVEQGRYKINKTSSGSRTITIWPSGVESAKAKMVTQTNKEDHRCALYVPRCERRMKFQQIDIRCKKGKQCIRVETTVKYKNGKSVNESRTLTPASLTIPLSQVDVDGVSRVSPKVACYEKSFDDKRIACSTENCKDKKNQAKMRCRMDCRKEHLYMSCMWSGGKRFQNPDAKMKKLNQAVMKSCKG